MKRGPKREESESGRREIRGRAEEDGKTKKMSERER